MLLLFKRLGASTLLKSFLGKAKRDAHFRDSRILGDTEIPIRDIEDVKVATKKLKEGLRDLPENGSVPVQEAKDACLKVAMIAVPSTLHGTNPESAAAPSQP